MKKFAALIMTAVMLLATACSPKTGDTNPNVSESDYYPITVTDQAGREVVIESEPSGIVSSYYITSSLLIALELDSKVVGIESTPEKRPIYSLSAPELLDLPWVGSPKDFDLETCIAVEPDLVILPLRLSDVADTLTELGIDVILVNPENQDLLLEMTEIVGAATNTNEKAGELETFLVSTAAMLDNVTASVEPKTVYLAGNSDFLSTAGSGMYQSDMIAAAGGINVAGDIDDTYWVEVSYEQVLAWNPEYIILAANAEYTVDDVLNNEVLSNVDAVINGNVYRLPSDAEAWDSPVPGGILGSVWLSNVLYPDLVTDEMCENKITEFYETFYGFNYGEI